MAAEHGGPYRGIDWEDELEKLPVNWQAIQRGLTRVAVWIEDHACERLFGQVDHLIDQLERVREQADAEALAEGVLRVAAYVHCEVIRIHPFVNGNGRMARMARMCLNYFARRYGIRAVDFQRVDGDYIDAIRTWLDRRVIEHFTDFLRPRWRRREDDRWLLAP